jgi:hypothetical protein
VTIHKSSADCGKPPNGKLTGRLTRARRGSSKDLRSRGRSGGAPRSARLTCRAAGTRHMPRCQPKQPMRSRAQTSVPPADLACSRPV